MLSRGRPGVSPPHSLDALPILCMAGVARRLSGGCDRLGQTDRRAARFLPRLPTSSCYHSYPALLPVPILSTPLCGEFVDHINAAERGVKRQRLTVDRRHSPLASPLITLLRTMCSLDKLLLSG